MQMSMRKWAFLTQEPENVEIRQKPEFKIVCKTKLPLPLEEKQKIVGPKTGPCKGPMKS